MSEMFCYVGYLLYFMCYVIKPLGMEGLVTKNEQRS